MKLKNKIKISFGLSLIELIVALAISSILAIGIINLYGSNKNSYFVQNDSSRLQDSGRFVFNVLTSDLRRTGYYGYNPAVDTVSGTETQVTNNNTCPANATWGLMLDPIITGLNDPAMPIPYACIASDYLTGDVLSLRYVDGHNETDFDENRYYLRSSFKTGRIFRGVDSNDSANIINDGTPESTGKLRAFAYYIGDSGRTCKFKDINGNSIVIPTLFRESLNYMGEPERQEVASGIENIQFKYGVDTNADHAVNQYFDSDSISHDINVTPNWKQVVSVRFWVLARADCPATKYKNTETYQMGDLPSYTPNDGFKRQLFTSTVALRN